MTTTPATPATLTAVLAAAQSGDTLVLTGTFPARTINSLKFNPSVIFDCAAAVLSGWRLNYCEGFSFAGGAWTGSGTSTAASGLFLVGCKNIKLYDAVMAGLAKAVRGNGNDGLEFLNLTITGQTEDGIILSDSRNILIDTVDISAPNIINPATHADAIQFFSALGKTPCADITVRNCTITGAFQGIFFGDQNVGGYDRITIEFNEVDCGFANGILAANARGVTLRENHVSTLAGSPNQCKITLGGCTNITRCGNTVAQYTTPTGANKPAVVDAACVPPIPPPDPPTPGPDPEPPVPPTPTPPVPPTEMELLQAQVAALTVELGLTNGRVTDLEANSAAIGQILSA